VVTECAEDAYETEAPTGTSDRVCAALTVCAEDEYESVAASATTDRECAACTACALERSPCTATEDAVCDNAVGDGGGGDGDGGVGDGDGDVVDAGITDGGSRDAAAPLDASGDASIAPPLTGDCGCVVAGGSRGGGGLGWVSLAALLALRLRRRDAR
jgi:MYXO-CTERM domain-containing protein